ncbi:MAG: glycosyltransferase [Planctomycetota bacterium]|jgi:glycosyltransferase involved in cell wall biosynthesis
MSQTVVVIPCYNEAQRLEVEAFREYAADHRSVRFLLVDDGSTDATAAMLRSMRDGDAEAFDVLTLPRNMGKAEAVRRGFLEAFERAPHYVAFWDADLATPLDAIADFSELLDRRPDLEVVFGSRVNLLGRSVRRNLARHYVGRVFATAAAAVLGLAVYDTQCGAKMFRVNEDTAGLFREPFVAGWVFDVEIVARMLKARRGTTRPPVSAILYEHPLMVWRDIKGSKVPLRAFVTVAVDLARIWFRYMRG